jgi:hypothetical protein
VDGTTCAVLYTMMMMMSISFALSGPGKVCCGHKRFNDAERIKKLITILSLRFSQNNQFSSLFPLYYDYHFQIKFGSANFLFSL